MSPLPDPAWERRHPDRQESWSFDFCASDGTLGGFVALTLRPPPAPAWYWAALVGPGRPYLLVRDLEVEPPRAPASREVRADGLWADVNCETPHDHWSVGLEAFGVAMDDPEEALGAERGDRTGLGLDLEWEAVDGLAGGEGRYDQPCEVHGEILIGAGSAVETIAFEGHGWRRHTWGDDAPWRPGESSTWLAGRLDDGTPHRAEGSGARLDPRSALCRAPLRLDGGVLERTLVRFSIADGRSGLGWHEQVR